MHRATISETDLAHLLGWPAASVKRLVARGEIPSWTLEDLDGRPLHAPRIGQRTARRLIRRELDGERARRALDALDEEGSGQSEQSGHTSEDGAEAGGLGTPARLDPRPATDADHPSARQGYVHDLKVAAKAHPGALSFAAYDRIARENGLARAARIADAFGGWNAAKREAGLRFAPARPRDRTPDEVLLAGLRAAAGEGDSLSLADYDAYASARGGMRTGAAVSSRFGSWSEAVTRAGLKARRPGWQGRCETDPRGR